MEATAGRDLSSGGKVLIQQPDVGQQPHRQQAVDGGLELQQQIDVEPTLTPAQAPDDVVCALAQVVADAISRTRSRVSKSSAATQFSRTKPRTRSATIS